MIDRFSKYGLPGLALFVLLYILNKFNFQFEDIGQSYPAVIAIMVISSVLIVTILVLILHHRKERLDGSDAAEAILLKYNQLLTGLASPKQNVLAIEQIANSNNPQRRHFLLELQKNASLSFLEQDAVSIALKCIDEKKLVADLYDSLHKKESDRWQRDVTSNGQIDMTWMAVWGLKIWRYLNRRNHHQFAAVEQALSRVIISQSLDKETFDLFNSLDIR
jgi:hypothetical protein